MILKQNKYILLFCALLFCLLTVTDLKAQETERILNFHSDIKVEQSGRVVVTETIRINVTGESISRGIVRTLPIYRHNKYGYIDRIDVNILSVKRDGKKEKYSTNMEGSDFAVYIGNANHYLSPNIYEYTIQYESYGHVGFFDKYDEIYWNVTGNDWAFPIDLASATVQIPKGAKVIDNTCYTGVKDYTSSDCSYSVEGDRIVNFTCTTHLEKGEGFTIATSFTPFIIDRTTSAKTEKWWSFFLNLPLLLFISLTAILYGYIKTVLKSVKTPIVIPSFNPPEGKSPAQLRYLDKKEIDSKALSASILSLAVKGFIIIKEGEEQDTFVLKSKKSNMPLSQDERVLLDKLFTSNKNVSITKAYSSSWKTIRLLWENSITKGLNILDYFSDKSTIRKAVIKPSLIILAIWTIVLFIFTKIKVNDLVLVLISILFCAMFILFIYILLKIKLTNNKIFAYTWKTISIFSIILLSKGIYEMIFDSQLPERGWTFVFYIFIIISGFLIITYYRKQTEKGAKISAEIKGFKMYLKTAEENRLNFLTSPDHTPEQFEKMLPYAVALDLEIKWAEKFSEILDQNNYQPNWYIGEQISSYTNFANTFSKSFTSTLTQTVESPTSNSESSSSRDDWHSDNNSRSSGSSSWSSGSNGSGSSGGGGGGGGGRGW